MKSYGICERAGVGALGIEIPLEPRTLTPAQASARNERQAAAIATGPAANMASRPSPAGPAGPAGSPRPVRSTPPAAGPAGLPTTSISAPMPAPMRVPESVPTRGSVPAAPAPGARVRESVAGQVLCEGGCGVLVAAEYIARTGKRHHGCCEPGSGARAAEPQARGVAA